MSKNSHLGSAYFMGIRITERTISGDVTYRGKKLNDGDKLQLLTELISNGVGNNNFPYRRGEGEYEYK